MIRTLTHDDFESLFAAFTAAFSDYVVKLSPTREQLLEMFTRRGWVPELSVAAFDGDALVAFTVNCAEGDRAYDSGTGVIPTHRRSGLARALMERSFELLAPRAYVLEVLDNNERAIALYRDLGFEVVRALQCWTFASSGRPVVESSRNTPRRQDDSATRQLWCDAEPSWQNTTSSLSRATAPRVILGNDDAYAILFPDTGDLAQLAVRPEARRRGLGTALLHEAAAVAAKPLRIINVDERHAGIAAFLGRAGAKKTVRQVEMIRVLER
ncbi:MAG TPA: GNAT family N-acetyltransferase [Thermoanaerobaculia bacterium]|nr:GNAT family N-acetyltransferase [Thermoanaerobaculia bacterium]